MMIQICGICKKEFHAKNSNFKYCGPECKKASLARNAKNFRNGNTVKREPKKKLHQELVDIAVEARKHGMSYGEYVAMTEYGKR